MESELRAQLVERAGGVCEECGNPAPGGTSGRRGLVAHHLAYERKDTLETLKLLCRRCHIKYHDRPDAPDRSKSLGRLGRRIRVGIDISAEGKRLLEGMAAKLGVSQSAVMELALREKAKREKVE